MPPLIRLLRAAYDNVQDLPSVTFDDAEIQWLIDTGFGPLLYRVTRRDPDDSLPSRCRSLLSADLTAKVLTADLTGAMCDIIDVTRASGTPLTLLKGISICGQHYPAEHLRLMGDIDFLVDEESYTDVEGALLDLGYSRHAERPKGTWQGHHHGAPLFDPKRKVWVEIHTALFPKDAHISTAPVFSQSAIRAERLPSRFHDRDVWRLSDELQLVYTASHWQRNLSNGFSRVSSALPLSDLVFLLRESGSAFNWDRVLGWLHHELLTGYLYVVLGYLDRHKLAVLPPEVMVGIERRQRIVSRTELAFLHGLIDKYIVDRKKFNRVLTARNTTIIWDTLMSPRRAWRNSVLVPWHLLFPPRDPDCFTMAYQVSRLKTLFKPRP